MRRFSIVFLPLFTLAFFGFAYGGGKFEPPSGKVILFVGQDTDAINSYLQVVRTVPAGLMCYTSLHLLEGLEDSYNEGGGVQDTKTLLDKYPDTVLQMGLYVVDRLEKIASGEYDPNLDQLAAWLKSTRRPIFLRIGYEFDLPENHYEPGAYKQAFRCIVDRFRKNGVENVAYVWHSCAQSDAMHIMDWYPGDDYVDWVGVSYFNQFPKFMSQVAEVAAKLQKPLILAETSPWYMKSPEARERWFKRLFQFIDQKDVKALCYINCDWDSLQMWQSLHYGDTRVQADPAILDLWVAETSRRKYLKSSPKLFKILGFKENQRADNSNDVQ